MEDMIAAAKIDLGDFFEFAIDDAATLAGIKELGVVRYQMTVSLATRRFERIRLDIGLSEPYAFPPNRIRMPDVLAFAEFAPLEVPTLPLEFHLAEKVQAYVRIYSGERPSSRVKYLIDLVLIRSTASFSAARLRQALRYTLLTWKRDIVRSWSFSIRY